MASKERALSVPPQHHHYNQPQMQPVPHHAKIQRYADKPGGQYSHMWCGGATIDRGTGRRDVTSPRPRTPCVMVPVGGAALGGDSGVSSQQSSLGGSAVVCGGAPDRTFGPYEVDHVYEKPN